MNLLPNLRRMFVIYKDRKDRLILSQVLLLVSAIATLLTATLTQRLINEGIQAGNPRVLVQTSIFMIVLAGIAGVALSGTAYLAVYFAQSTVYVIRDRVYRKAVHGHARAVYADHAGRGLPAGAG